ncbi:MAG: FeoB small GTPase domain-containing protein [Oscillospiraceae bacterium]
MGLTSSSTGFAAAETSLEIKRRSPDDRVVAIAGNPNVGKSTIFNALTGMRQHTGNWPGKTVAAAQGFCETERSGYVLVDIPGTYSLLAHSAEEEAARDFLCFGGAEAAVVVCDATCLQRSLNLALQVMELCPKTLVCVNLCDEAKRRGITLDLKQRRISAFRWSGPPRQAHPESLTSPRPPVLRRNGAAPETASLHHAGGIRDRLRRTSPAGALRGAARPALARAAAHRGGQGTRC